MLTDWQLALDAKRNMESDLDWVFANGDEILANHYGASIGALWDCLGLGDIWGPQGEGVTLYANQYRTMNLAAPFLRRGDKEGWLAFAENIRNRGSFG